MPSGRDIIISGIQKPLENGLKNTRYEIDKIRGFHWQNMITFFILILS